MATVKGMNERGLAKLASIIDQHGRRPESLVAILQEVQDEYRYLPEEVITYIATSLDLPAAMVYGVATFYAQFSLEPKGKYIIKVCDGTACHVRGADHVCAAIRKVAGLTNGGDTTVDLKFTVEKVYCVGACGLAPVVMVNDDEVHGKITPEEAVALVETLAAKTEDDSDERTVPEVRQPEEEQEMELRRFSTPKQLQEASVAARDRLEGGGPRILVCAGTGCVAGGALQAYQAIREEVEECGLPLQVELKQHHPVPQVRITGCHGLCENGPLVKVEPQGFFYVGVTAEHARPLVASVLQEKPYPELLYTDGEGKQCLREEDVPFYQQQTRVSLADCGNVDPESLESYLAHGGHQALSQVLSAMNGDEVIEELKVSGLRGRGGGGFPTGRKWQSTRDAAGEDKYVVCNADEGDPGAFMDRSLLEGAPHRILEGMIIAGYAIGAGQGYIYVRSEYPLAVKRIRMAVEQARASGLLGDNILGSGYNFDIMIKEGAGAFVCGEETALLSSIEGERGMPRPRPPFPATSGLWGKPTLINNVETLANVPDIIKRGGSWFAGLGTADSSGTKTFALGGQVKNTGLIEVPMGITLREIIFDIGGGMRRDLPFKAVQIVGPSGGCLTEAHLDMELDYETVVRAGAMVGSGGLVVMDEGSCMVEVAKFFMGFVQNESCGKCVPCREGTKQMLAILERITVGEGNEDDLVRLETLGSTVREASLCGLGKSAPNPVLTTMHYFYDEYRAHVEKRVCPAGVCAGLKPLFIDEDACKGCTACLKVCPVDAIKGRRKEVHRIDASACIRCNACVEKCRFNAIR